MKRASWLALALALPFAACASGARDESGRMVFGSSVYDDDPVTHAAYPSYAEYAVATGQLDDMAKDGYSREQQVCFAQSFVKQLPPALQAELEQFATNETALTESEYAALSDKVSSYARDEARLRAAAADFEAACLAR